MTEAGPTGILLFPHEQAGKTGPIGRKALPGADIVIMRTDGNPAGSDNVGEIWLQAGSIMKGY